MGFREGLSELVGVSLGLVQVGSKLVADGDEPVALLLELGYLLERKGKPLLQVKDLPLLGDDLLLQHDLSFMVFHLGRWPRLQLTDLTP